MMNLLDTQVNTAGMEYKISHTLADGSLWELSGNDNDEAIMQMTGEDRQRDEETSNASSTNNSGMRSKDTRSAQRRRSSVNRSVSLYQDHDHDLSGCSNEHPMSLLQRRVRVGNRSRKLLVNGIYQLALAVSWPSLLLCLVASYLTVVATIALLICISIHCEFHKPLEQRTESEFASKYGKVFFFCVQTISTVGYGSLSPRQDSDTANFFVFLLVFSGLFVSTLVTDITWSKFSIPKASTLLYSDFLLLTSFHSHRAVMFRAGNNRQYGVLVEGSFRMNIVVLNRDFGRRETHELRLFRNVWPIINLCNTLTHIIDESSPLYHLSTDELLSGDHFFVVLFTGQDRIISDTMVARKAYHACDILVDNHFEDNITLTTDGLYIDLDAMNATYYDPNWNEDEQVDPERCPNSTVSAPNENDSPRLNYERMADGNDLRP